MSEVLDSADRHHAPEGKSSQATQLILVGTLIVALCFIVYLLMFNKRSSHANAAVPEVKQAKSQLHTSDTLFEMPVFKASALPEPVKVVDVEPAPEVMLDPLPVPEPIPMSEVLVAPVPVSPKQNSMPSQPVKDKPVSDEARRLSGGVSGNKGVATSIASNTDRDSSRVSSRGINPSSQPKAYPVQSNDAYIPSVYEYKEGQTNPNRRLESSEITSNDLDRLDRMAALYGVSDGFSRGNSKVSTGSRSASYDSIEPAGQTHVTHYNGDTQSGARQQYEPINQETTQRSSSRNSGIDLSSTQVVSTHAKRINLDFLLKRGTYISCVLKTRIVSDQAGFISCGVTENIYSANGKYLLIPRGSDVLGEYKPKSLSTGKVRLHAVWDALTTPDGLRVNLGSPSTGALGASGIGGQINNHYGQKVGIPILLSLFRTAIDYRTLSFSGESGEYQRTGTDAADDVLSDQIQQYEEVRPTLTKHQGATIGIMIARDVSFENVLARSR